MSPLDSLKQLWNQGYGSSVSHDGGNAAAAASMPAMTDREGYMNFGKNVAATLMSRLPSVKESLNTPSLPVVNPTGAPEEEDTSFWDYVYSRLNDGTSGGGSGVDVNALISDINQSYDRQRAAADVARQQSLAGIQGAYDLFGGNINRNYADYTQATQASQAAMANRLAQQIADQTARQQELNASASSMGQDIGALRAQQAGNLAALQASGGFQSDLGNRLAQIVANNQRALQGSGEMIRQGAVGNLENNYNAMLGALAAQREQQIMSARSAGSGGGGGGSKPTTLQDILKEFETIDKLDKYSGKKSKEMFPGVSADTLYNSWTTLAQSDDENDQALADMIQQELRLRD